jgi:hypothetical protein
LEYLSAAALILTAQLYRKTNDLWHFIYPLKVQITLFGLN